jgi:hypothetical protein
MLLTTGQQAGPSAAQACERGEVPERGLQPRRGGQPVEPEVLGHGEAEEDAPVVRHVRDALAGPRGRADPQCNLPPVSRHHQ